MKPQKPAPRLAHEPGEKVYIDYCDGLKLTCPITEKKTKTHFFCGVLPFSSYTFGCFTENQKLPNFIRCHEKMWAYFGGVTPYAVIDNLSQVLKKHIYMIQRKILLIATTETIRALLFFQQDPIPQEIKLPLRQRSV